MTILQIALGGALGAMLRYGCAQGFAFPFGTFFVNVFGSFVMGIALVALVENPDAKVLGNWHPFVMTGLLGGFTTFSAFSLDTLKLFERGDIWGAGVYVLGTVSLCVCAIGLGAFLGRSIWL